MTNFYDTCALLDEQENAFSSFFLISAITLAELENIKNSAFKDETIKYKARHLLHLLNNNEDKYVALYYDRKLDLIINQCPELIDNNDTRIILTALLYDLANRNNLADHKKNNILKHYPFNKLINYIKHPKKRFLNFGEPTLCFITSDLSCKTQALSIGLKTKSLLDNDNVNNYTGFFEVFYSDDNELEFIYNKIYETNKSQINYYNLFVNEYLLIKNKQTEEIVDSYKFTKDHQLEQIHFTTFKSRYFGEIKPKDPYQIIAFDSLKNNKMTMLKGSAGTGKSYIALGYLISQLEKNNIDKIIIFCNTVATKDSAKLGYYPGSREQKLLDSAIGNFLISKIGGQVAVESLINENKLELLPMSDIRGYDTTGMRAGIYITEAQNFNINLIKIALQRIGEDCICILDGDNECQVDMATYGGNNNGLRRVSQVFRGDSEYGEITLQNIYRSHIAKLAESL